MNERILALDIGDVRIGIAVSDEQRIIAQPVEVYKRVGYGPDTRHIQALCEKYETTKVLSGLPLNMDGTEGGQAQKVRGLCQQLENAGLTVFYQDERLTTVTAERALLEGSMSRQGRKGTVDKVAAAVILQQWLDRSTSSVSATSSTEEEAISTLNRNEDETMDENNNIIELIDENDEAVAFEHLMTLEYEGDYYIVLMTVEEDEESEEGEVLILKLDKDEKGEDCYVTIDDDDVTQAVFDKFIAAIEEDDDELPENIDGDEDDIEDEE